jgi:DNA polymerase
LETRRDKLVKLQELMDLEDGTLYTDTFEYENSLYEKAIKLKSLAARIGRCKLCPGLNVKRFTESAPGWGNPCSPILFVGQSLHEPGVCSGLPFIKGCGYCIDAALRLSGLLRKDVFLTNVVHCHPEKNRTSTAKEKKNCRKYLIQELQIIKPKLIVAMGNDAKEAITDILRTTFVGDFPKVLVDAKILRVKHPAAFMYGSPEERQDWIVKLSLEMDKCLT